MGSLQGDIYRNDVDPANRLYGISKHVEVNCLIRRGRFPKLATILMRTISYNA